MLRWLCFYTAAALLLKDENDIVCYPNTPFVLPVANVSYCNPYGYGIESGGFYDLSAQKIVLSDRKIITYVRIDSNFSAWIEQPNATSGYYYNDSTGHSIYLSFCTNVIATVVAWEPTQSRFWTLGNTTGMPRMKMFSVEPATEAMTYWNIVTNEPVADLVWNGTDIVATIYKNNSYYAVPFLRSNKHLLVGPQSDYLEFTETLPVLNANYTKFCSMNCTQPVGITSTTTSQDAVSTTQQIWQISTSSVFIFTGVSFQIPGGVLHISDGTVLQVDVSGVTLQEGDEYLLFTYTALEGQFAAIELYGVSCTSYRAEVTSSPSETKFRVLSETTSCAAADHLNAVYQHC